MFSGLHDEEGRGNYCTEALIYELAREITGQNIGI